MPTTFERERQLQEEIASRVEHDLPGVDVLAVELLTPTLFCVFVDHPDGVDHALCKRVTDVLRDYLREKRNGPVHLRVPQRGEKRALAEVVISAAS